MILRGFTQAFKLTPIRGQRMTTISNSSWQFKELTSHLDSSERMIRAATTGASKLNERSQMRSQQIASRTRSVHCRERHTVWSCGLCLASGFDEGLTHCVSAWYMARELAACSAFRTRVFVVHADHARMCRTTCWRVSLWPNSVSFI